MVLLRQLRSSSTAQRQAAPAYARAHPSSPYAADITSTLLHSPSTAAGAVTTLHPLFIAGIVALIVGTMIRISCYRTLGQLFTFELSIRDKHRLMTHGPYSIVRHPSYVGSFFSKTGMALCAFGPGSWLWEAGWMRTIQGQCLMVFPATGDDLECITYPSFRGCDMDNLSTIKVGLLIFANICYHICVTPPNKAPPSQESSRYVNDFLGSRTYIAACTAIVKTVLYSTTLFEAATAYANTHPSSPYAGDITSILSGSPSTAAKAITHLHPAFLVGIAFQVIGAFIRLSCYRALGQLFTFELTIRDQHKLVTHGPYSIVRHPSYVGSFFAMTGMVLATFGPGSWLSEAGWTGSVPVQCVAVAMCWWAGHVLLGMTRRTAVEDRVLKKEFGVQWDKWAKRVPYRLIPGVY
ncbi:hypothetical protein EWM64_g6444 [Hericium alpestre]|uniref:Protein-S-isoprenylcysteine O-methyltransferase n=1 Tax=Hericium alpestre TaxID=135208 RepID=A0A4Y9ZTJ9_9AGAM|nr:hypothetical protein EWM64_g6444 [Hericium alpestre]